MKKKKKKRKKRKKRRRRSMKLVDDLRKNRGYGKWRGEALDHTL